MGLSRQWYIDSWAVRDGMAFASFRTPGDYSQVERTIFMGVPGLEAVPVGRVSPALRATRATFQDGFHSENGEEIGFENLSQVKELVRRGYLASGWTDEGGQAEAEPRGPRDGPDVGELLEAAWDQDRLPRPVSDINLEVPDDRKEFFERLLDARVVQSLYAHLATLAASTIAEWSAWIQNDPKREDEHVELAQWTQALFNAGLWNSPRALEKDLQRAGYHRTSHYLGEWLLHDAWWWWRMPTYENAQNLEEVIFRVPCPRGVGAPVKMRYLADILLLATSSESALNLAGSPEKIVPALLLALATVGSSRAPLIFASASSRHERLRLALTWLSEQMPQQALPHSAESALTAFALREHSGT